MLRRRLTGCVAVLLLGAADADSPLKVAERCERAPALSPFELADLAVVHPPSGVSPPPCTRRLLEVGPRADKVLLPLLSHDDHRVAARAARLLGLLGRMESAPAIVQALPAAAPAAEASGAVERTKRILQALGRIGGATAASALAERVRGDAAWRALGAGDALSQIGGPAAVAALQTCAATDCAAPWAAVAGVDQLQSEPPPSPLVARCADVLVCWRSVLRDGEAPERELAARWAGRLLATDKDAAGDLLRALRDPADGVRRWAREALLRHCRAGCAQAAREQLDSPQLRPTERVWLRYVLLRGGR